jgi:phosphoadenosine phosphosulfate reductase
MLVEKQLFGTINKVKMAIDRLKSFEPSEGFYLAFSGGKDSIVLKELADMANVKYDAEYSLTTIDPPELVKFIRQYHQDVNIDYPKEPFLKRLEYKGFPIRQAR